jgi:hypothetical protein
MLEEARQTNAVVCKMWFLANDHYIVISPLDIVLHEFLATIRLVYIPMHPFNLGYSHERNAHHTQANDHDPFPWVVIIDLTLLL